MKTGSTTGCTRSIMTRAALAAAAQGYAPGALAGGDEVADGRPGPLQMTRWLELLGIDEPACVIKADDTEAGIAEGVAAGARSICVTLSGNPASLTEADLAALPANEPERLREKAVEALRGAGAAHVIDAIAELPALIEGLEA